MVGDERVGCLMATIFVISDHHFDHANILRFTRADGSRVRTFADVTEMNEHMVDMWNRRVRPCDHVYHLGDFAFGRKGLEYARRLNGHLRLVRGNHDVYQTRWYTDVGFKEIYGIRVLENLVLSHVPLHPASLKPKWTNVHGHLHNNQSDTSYTPHLGRKYFNVSVEVLQYVPLSLEEVRSQLKTWEVP